MKQKLKFSELYINCKKLVKDVLSAIWCSNTHTEQQKRYAEQLQKIAEDIFAPNEAMPIVECMDPYETISEQDKENALNLVNGLWKKKFLPYKHQYKSWQVLRKGFVGNKVKSIVVTTGTGSGKTECFMNPLVADLLDQWQENKINGIKAIFIYPLNALMEDQKLRLQELLNGTSLHFAVYNGNLVESEPSDSDDSPKAELERARIEHERKRFPNILATRKEMRMNKPDILLTNPTMLEYIMLRNKDRVLFKNSDLRWIVIDETHSYTGAGAAELSLLMRRVLMAFNKTPDYVRFATSSATIGNGNPKDINLKLKRFICGISGQSLEQIEIIGGNRVINTSPASSNIAKYRELLHENGYIKLDQLIPEDDLTIEQRLEKLDSLCEDTEDEQGLQAKVHFFFHVPNKGVFVRLDDYNHQDGIFSIYSSTPLDSDSKDNTPYLQLVRCGCCGNYIAIGNQKGEDEYGSLEHEASSLFEREATNHFSPIVFGLRKRENKPKVEGNVPIEIEENKYHCTEYNDKEWSIVTNINSKCPYCGEELKSKDDNNENDDDDFGTIELQNEKIISFKLSTDFISRIIAPVILDAMQPDDKNYPNAPHHGQQFVSFVDSRQAAAKSTLSQNLEQERLWIESKIFHELTRISKERGKVADVSKKKEALEKNLEELNNAISKARETGDIRIFDLMNKKDDIAKELQQIKPVANIHHAYLTWKEIFDLLDKDPISDSFCFQFSNRSEGSDELDQENIGKVSRSTKVKYIYSAMVEQLGRRPLRSYLGENLGLFTSYYPDLDNKISNNDDDLPSAVKEFNQYINNTDSSIHASDWKSLLKIYMDHSVRSRESFFLKDRDFDVDIWSCQRFETRKAIRRPAEKPKENGRGVVKNLLAALLTGKNNPNNDEIKASFDSNKTIINKVADEAWKTLKEKIQLIERSEKWDEDKKEWVYDEIGDDIGRLNLMKLGFKLYDHAFLCDVRKNKEEYKSLRPEETLFKGFSPCYTPWRSCRPEPEMEIWPAYPYPYGKKEDGTSVSNEDIVSWAEKNRRLLCKSGLWGKNGLYTNRLNTIYKYPDLFIQAEHTAQIDKIIARQSQELFRDNKAINILACSTTMEMGIDLGSLEAVLMCSVPPHPANYKQRAGRSGRAGQNRSICITLCESDIIGYRTLYDPMNQLILRRTEVPFVDLDSPQVVQRHVNALLLRESGTLDNGKSNNLDQQIIDFFTNFSFQINPQTQRPDYTTILSNDTAQPVYPSQLNSLGDKTNTPYFHYLRFIDSGITDTTQKHLNQLICGTCFDGNIAMVCYNAKHDIQRCYNEIEGRTNEIGISFERLYQDIKERLEKQGKDSSTVSVINRVNSRKSAQEAIAAGYLHKYSEILSYNLLMYLATHRITPNANMPVNIIEFDINMKNMKQWGNNGTSNPTYPLRQALSQYAPGNPVVLSNRVRTVRGIVYKGWAQHEAYKFKRISSDGDRVIIGTKEQFKSPKDYILYINRTIRIPTRCK